MSSAHHSGWTKSQNSIRFETCLLCGKRNATIDVNFGFLFVSKYNVEIQFQGYRKVEHLD